MMLMMKGESTTTTDGDGDDGDSGGEMMRLASLEVGRMDYFTGDGGAMVWPGDDGPGG